MTHPLDIPAGDSLRRLASRAAGRFRAQTIDWRGGWRDRILSDAARDAQAKLTLHNLGPELRIGELPTRKPIPLASFTVPLYEARDSVALHHAAGCDPARFLDSAATWGVEINLQNISAASLDPGQNPDMPIADASMLFVGPYKNIQRDLVAQVITELADAAWVAIQYETLGQRATLDAGGRTASEEADRYLEWYFQSGPLGSKSFVERCAVWRERWLALARRWRNADAQRAAEYVQTALSTLGGYRLVTSAPRYTQSALLESWNPSDHVFDSRGNLLKPAEVAAAIRTEFEDLTDRLRIINAKIGGRVLALSSSTSEGLAVWREFALAVLMRQEAIRPLWPQSHLRTPADVIAPHENAESDSDYVRGFRACATVALHCSPWPLTSAQVAFPALLMPISALAELLPLSDLNALPHNSLIAADQRLAQITTLPADDGALAWPDWIFARLTPPMLSLPAMVESALARHEEEPLEAYDS